MKSMAKWMLGAALVAGGLGLGATKAQAAEWGMYVGGPVAYVPPYPGPGYAWVAGYYSGGYWVPGRWNYVGVRYYDRDDYRYARYHRDWDEHRYYHDRDDHRDWDRHHDRDWDSDHFRR
jgi:hypothetical protein